MCHAECRRDTMQLYGSQVQRRPEPINEIYTSRIIYVRTSRRPGSTEMQERVCWMFLQPGNASRKARTRTRERSWARRTTAVSAEA